MDINLDTFLAKLELGVARRFAGVGKVQPLNLLYVVSTSIKLRVLLGYFTINIIERRRF